MDLNLRIENSLFMVGATHLKECFWGLNNLLELNLEIRMHNNANCDGKYCFNKKAILCICDGIANLT